MEYKGERGKEKGIPLIGRGGGVNTGGFAERSSYSNKGGSLLYKGETRTCNCPALRGKKRKKKPPGKTVGGGGGRGED